MLKIIDVNISSDYSWGDIKNLRNWDSFKNTNKNWQQTKQTAIVNHPVFVEVEVVETNWLYLAELNSSWLDIKNKYANWNEVKNIRKEELDGY